MRRFSGRISNGTFPRLKLTIFVGYTLNQLFLFGDSEWSKEQFRDCPIWAKKRMQDLFKHVR